MIDKLIELKNSIQKIEDLMHSIEFNKGDKVNVLDYNNGKYRKYEGVVIRDNRIHNPFPKYSYTIEIEGLERTQFDETEITKLAICL